MNIREAKEEIKRAVLAYTAKTEGGRFQIPQKRQRPVLLIGPPGIGKTAIVEQIAEETSLGFVAYTMTHHTRQSAVGLPVLEKRNFQGKEYTVTAYTMSEILASVYEQMEQTGRREGILFLDEINCISETLMPAILQFLQYKTFGGHALPEGWVIVAAGNPSLYNRSVREFDTVTLDRVKRMDVEPDLEVWKRYALSRGLHPAVLSFLELRPECFYVMEPGQKGFVTGRGWEDLSEMLLTLESLGHPVEEVLFGQYLQEKETVRLFAFYYRLYEKWSGRLCPEKLLSQAGEGEFPDLSELPGLSFDERLCILWLFLERLFEGAAAWEEQEKLFKSLGYFADGLKQRGGSGASWEERCMEQLERRRQGLAVRRECGLLPTDEEGREERLTELVRTSVEQGKLSGREEALADTILEEGKKAQERKALLSAMARRGIAFVRQAFGEGRELVIFLTNLTEHPGTARILREELPGEYEIAADFLNADEREAALRREISGKA